MNKLIIPSPPNWYEVDIMACSPDNTLIYGSRQDIIVIKPTSVDLPDQVEIIAKAHSSRIISVNINRNWGNPHKYAVTVSEDKVVKLWDIDMLERVQSHNKHLTDNSKSKVICAQFAGDDRVISVSENGEIVIWNLVQNETKSLTLLSEIKATVTCMSVCPHASWLAAFGLKTGLIVILDLRKNGQILFKLRGHEKSIVSLSWCPVPVNVFPLKPHNKVVEKVSENLEEEEKVVGEKDYRRKQENPKKREDTEKSTVLVGSEEILQGDSQKLEIPRMAHRKKGRGSLVDILIENDVKSPPNNENGDADIPTNQGVTGLEISNSNDLELEQTLSNNSILSSELSVCDKTDSDRRTTHGVESNSLPSNIQQSSDKESQVKDDKGSVEDSTENQEEIHVLNDEDKIDNLNSGEASGPKNDNQDVESEEQKCDKKENEDDWRNKEEQPRKEYLLASSSKDSNIYIWRAGTDGRMQTFLSLPHKSFKKGGRNEKMWTCLCWAAPQILLSSSRNAELIRWTLPKPLDQSKFMHVVHRDHWSVLFSIKTPITYYDEYNFLQNKDINVWTTGMERLILNTNLKSQENLNCYQTFGANINCIVGSPLDPNRLAMGSGEGTVHIWDISKDHKKKIYLSTFYQKILSSVTALAWHPLIETSLAWGTAEGRIGIFDINGKSKNNPKVFQQYFKSQIYKIEWGPLQESNDKGLYVVSEGSIGIFDPKDTNKVPPLLELPDNTFVYTMSWKPDLSMHLVSSKAGALICYDASLKISNISYVPNRLQSILWHPDAITNDVTVSKYCQTFVSIVQSTEFIVFDFSKEGENEEKQMAHFKTRGHFKNKSLINCIAWSPHNGSQLVFVDEVGVAQVFDIESQTILCTYINPTLDALYSVYWSPLDADYIITASIRHKITIWKVSENMPLTEKEINVVRNKISKAFSKEVSNLLVKSKVEDPSANNNKTNTKKTTKSENLPTFYTFKPKNESEDIRKLLKWKLENISKEPTTENSESLDILDIFGEQSDLEKVLTLNINAFKNRGKYQNSNILLLFKGDVSEEVKSAIIQKRVNPWIISISPMISITLWQMACETYAEQLQEDENADPMEIVTYLLACHKVEKAVHILSNKMMFKEAFVLAKTRLGVDSPLLTEVLEKWGKDLNYHGAFARAAQCYVVIGKYQEAASALFRLKTSNLELLKLGVELAQLSGNEELLKALQFKFNAFKSEETVEDNTGVDENENVKKQVGIVENSNINGGNEVTQEKENVIRESTGDSPIECSLNKLNAQESTEIVEGDLKNGDIKGKECSVDKESVDNGNLIEPCTQTVEFERSIECSLNEQCSLSKTDAIEVSIKNGVDVTVKENDISVKESVE